MTDAELQAIVQRAVDEDRAKQRDRIYILLNEVDGTDDASMYVKSVLGIAADLIANSIGQPVEIDHDING